jgi:glycosyltransferase involved in cell wall biosynthesis
MHQGVNERGVTASSLDSESVELTVIVPTRNEANNILPLLTRVSAALAGESFEVVFVDDSTDQTPEIVSEAVSTSAFPITLVARPETRRNGLSGAVVEGIEVARGRWLCVIDGDLQHPPEMIPRLLDQARRTGADIVVASRQADIIGPIGLSRARALTSQILTIMARMVFPRVLKNVSDPLTGFFLVRRAAVDPSILQPEGFKILLEILVRHPDLRVTELLFDFGPRHEGQSKADLNEGMRFFRHLTRLRLTVNQHLIRFLILLCLAVTLNLTLMAVLVAGLNWPVLPAAGLAGGLVIIALTLGEAWVFSDRPRGLFQRRLLALVILSLLFLIIFYLPIIWLLVNLLGMPYLVATLFGMVFAGFVYYLLSEQWIWTRGLMMKPRDSHYYDIHGILSIASQIPLDDLAYFTIPEAPARIDLQLRVDRHGTPSRVSGAICYDEHLGRFGFGLTVIPGDYTEIVVSPLLETSPEFVYTNVVEPVLRWMMVSRDFALVRAAAIQSSEQAGKSRPAVLITGKSNLGDSLRIVCDQYELPFLGDDRVILSRNQQVLSFPKPVTVNQAMLPEHAQTLQTTLTLRLRRWLYSEPVRRIGLFLSKRHIPAATINTYLQRSIPQPKYQMNEVSPAIRYADVATLGHLIILEKGVEHRGDYDLGSPIQYLLAPGEDDYGFQPSPLLLRELSQWQDLDWAGVEKEIIRDALRGATLHRSQVRQELWWEEFSNLIMPQPENPIVIQKPRPIVTN